jgi:hypothetical protein
VAGVEPGIGGKFGTLDDVSINFGQQNPAITASIASVTIKGQVRGTPGVGDNFGFCAQRIGSVSVGGSPVALKLTSKDFLALGPTFDVRVNEV